MPSKKDDSQKDPKKVNRKQAVPVLFDGRFLTDPKEIRDYRKFWKKHIVCAAKGKYGGITAIRKSNGIGCSLYMLCWTCKQWDDIANVGTW